MPSMELMVKDMKASVRFYNQVLGFEASGTEAFMELSRGQVTINLCPSHTLPDHHYFVRKGLRTVSQPGLGVEIVLAVDDVEALYKHCVLSSPNAICEGLVSQPWGLTDFRVVDPDGYYIRIQEAQ